MLLMYLVLKAHLSNPPSPPLPPCTHKLEKNMTWYLVNFITSAQFDNYFAPKYNMYSCLSLFNNIHY